jgi:hypothetical protein
VSMENSGTRRMSSKLVNMDILDPQIVILTLA